MSDERGLTAPTDISRVFLFCLDGRSDISLDGLSISCKIPWSIGQYVLVF